MLISENSVRAYYQREEVAAAIALARTASDRHRVVPLYLKVDSTQIDVPYGLRLKHGISLGERVDLAQAAARLLDLKRRLNAKSSGTLAHAGRPQLATGRSADEPEKSAIRASPALSPHDDSPTSSLYAAGEILYLKKDFVAAYEQFLRAAEQDHSKAQVAVGYMHWHGQGCNKSAASASSWFRYAADRGDATSIYLLGLTHSERHSDGGNAEDQRQEVRLMFKAAETGLGSAQVRLGVMYLQGRGVTQDFGEAMKWYVRAADRGIASAMGNIAELYEKGLGVPQDPVRAALWNRREKEQWAKNRTTTPRLPWSDEQN